jgi:hypothetical protein
VNGVSYSYLSPSELRGESHLQTTHTRARIVTVATLYSFIVVAVVIMLCSYMNTRQNLNVRVWTSPTVN